MALLAINHLTKKYQISKDTTNVVLNDINYEFPSCGLVTIFGKSGSGKSTLLNLIALMDKPSSGGITLDNKDIFKYKEKTANNYRNKTIGIVFQHYNLLDDETALYNISLPLLISGETKKCAEKYAQELAKKCDLKLELLNKEIKYLSGGEKQRIALLRALSTSPRILLCDEPTGALDSKNSKIIMDILKRYSERHLVILISHNQTLVEEYSDIILHLKDGSIANIENKRKNNIELPLTATKAKQSSKWVNHIVWKNIKRRKKRNIFSILGLSICLTATLLVVGFNVGSQKAIVIEGRKQLDYGSLILSKELNNKISGSNISITQTIRPTINEINNIKPYIANYFTELNFDFVVPSNIDIKISEKAVTGINYTPIYSFDESMIQTSLIYKGKNVKNEYTEVLINDSAYNKIKEFINEDPLNKTLELSHQTIVSYLPTENFSEYIQDQITYQKKMRIVGVVHELSFLQTPKVYYSYTALCEELNSIQLENLSHYLNRPISVYERVLMANNQEEMSSYSYRLFPKSVNSIERIETDINQMPKPFVLSSNSYTIANTFSDLLSSISLGLEIFLVIACLGSFLIMGIVSISSYTEDKRRSAILSAIGASKNNILSVYINESVLIGIISLLLSFVFAPLIQLGGNFIVKQMINIENIIFIPLFETIFNVPYFLPVIAFISIIFVCLCSTIIPILFSKKISVKDELQSI